jgi:hypothetical protein
MHSMGPLDQLPATHRSGLRSAAGAVRTNLAAGRLAARGQMLVLFVVSIFVLTGITAIVVDVSWYWANSLRVQRAADAAALAGVVWLPGNPTTAYSTARAEATKNGYTSGGGTVVTPIKDPDSSGNNRRLGVTISAPVGTFFMKIFGISTITATRSSKAEFVLPVPMGSPENYYGVFGTTRGLTETSQVTNTVVGPSQNTGFDPMTVATPASGAWTNPTRANGNNDDLYADSAAASGSTQQWGTFSPSFTAGGSAQIPASAVIDGLEVQLRAVLSGSGSPTTTCDLVVDTSWNGGTTWSSPQTATLTTSEAAYGPWGTASSYAIWGAHTWIRSDFDDANFRVRLTWSKPNCGASRSASVDTLQVQVTYHTVTTTTTTVTNPVPDQDLEGPGTACSGVASCFHADGATLNPRGFWATMNSEGSANVNGDAFQPYYDTPTSATNAAYDATTYYNYAVEVPAGASGSVYVYDPVFCAVALNRGTGDRWFSGAGDQVSSFFELYDTRNTLYDMTDDTVVADSAGLFQKVAASDSTMGGGTSGSECRSTTVTAYGDGRDYHDQWYRLASGLSGGPSGKVYRIHTTATDPSNVVDQRSVDAANSFALYSSIPGSRIYGLGAMQMFTPLSASGSAVSSEFYLAQIDAIHAGKTVEISLWDPGDTRPLSASVEILVPDASGWTATALDYTAAQGTTNGAAANCNSLSGNGVGSIQTNVGNTNGTYNGCWLTIQIPIPTGYTAQQSGWWKIRYTMNGNGTSSDVTTWKVQIRGNPVHLIVP